MKHIIITAFEPFGSSARNSSYDVLKELPDDIGGVKTEKLLLPVEYDRCADRLFETVNSDTHAVICLGQAEGRSAVTPEYAALNVSHSHAADNAGVVKTLERISADSPDALFATIPVNEIVCDIKAKDIPAVISFSAGTYVCNNLMFHSLEYCRPLGIPCGFIHLPISDEIKALENRTAPSLPHKMLTDAVAAAAGTVLRI